MTGNQWLFNGWSWVMMVDHSHWLLVGVDPSHTPWEEPWFMVVICFAKCFKLSSSAESWYTTTFRNRFLVDNMNLLRSIVLDNGELMVDTGCLLEYSSLFAPTKSRLRSRLTTHPCVSGIGWTHFPTHSLGSRWAFHCIMAFYPLDRLASVIRWAN